MNKRDFMKSGVLAAALLPLAGFNGAMAAPSAGSRRLLPLPLNPGDTVGLVSPSKATDEALDLQIAQEVNEQQSDTRLQIPNSLFFQRTLRRWPNGVVPQAAEHIPGP